MKYLSEEKVRILLRKARKNGEQIFSNPVYKEKPFPCTNCGNMIINNNCSCYNEDHLTRAYWHNHDYKPTCHDCCMARNPPYEDFMGK